MTFDETRWDGNYFDFEGMNDERPIAAWLAEMSSEELEEYNDYYDFEIPEDEDVILEIEAVLEVESDDDLPF